MRPTPQYFTVAEVEKQMREGIAQSIKSREAADNLARKVARFLREEVCSATADAAQNRETCDCIVCVARRAMREALAAYIRTE